MSFGKNILKVLVTGADGQLGMDLVNTVKGKADVIGLGRSEMDVTDFHQVRHILHHERPDVIIHAAAFTKVDQAEMEQEETYRVNAYGTRNIALLSEEISAKLCFISTDYVFDGESTTPYHEFDKPLPKTVYGKSKLAGEEFVRAYCKRSFIVRTSWLYGLYGKNFVKTMLELSKKQDTIRVVNDQFGSPTYTVDLCNFIVMLIETDFYGTYHSSNSGECSWYEFAKTVFEISGLQGINIEPCSTEQFRSQAPRPKYSILDHMAMRCNGFPAMRPWYIALKDFLQTYKINTT